ncbi:MAG: YdeI/OmpD-associated family protein [Pyrinomonadaceae bacterium]
MADKQTFETRLFKHVTLNATGIEIPLDVKAVFGAKRVPVRAEINGVEYRGSIVSMGGKYLLGIPKVFREAAGVAAGDNIVVTIEKDLEERTVTVPSDFEAAIADAGLEGEWQRLSYTHKKEHVGAIEEAKQPETRVRRIVKAIEMINARKK